MDCTHRSAPHRRHCDTVLYCIKPHTFLRKPILTPGSDPSVVLDPTLTIFYAIASVVSTIALVLKVKVFIQQLRERRSELSALDEDVQTERSRKLKTHKKRLVQTTRSIHMAYTSMMVGIAECIPLGILQGFSFLFFFLSIGRAFYPIGWAFYKARLRKLQVAPAQISLCLCSGVFAASAPNGSNGYTLADHHLVCASDPCCTQIMQNLMHPVNVF